VSDPEGPWAERTRPAAIRPGWHSWADDEGWWHAFRQETPLSEPDDRVLHAPGWRELDRLLSKEDGQELALAGRPS
jgi:hypothetical protein